MVGKTARIKKAERERFRIIKEHCGCLPCLLMGHPDMHTTIQHVVAGFKRVGEGSDQHKFTYGACPWHHFGHVHNRKTYQWMSGEYGPPLTWGRKIFEEHFGDEVEILIPVQDYMLSLFEERPWPEYHTPREVARKVRHHWIELIHANEPSQSFGRSR